MHSPSRSSTSEPSIATRPVSPRTRRLAFWLEEVFRLPGTRYRFGLDFVLGLLPGVGDFAGMVLGLPILWEGVRSRLPFRVLLVMLFNILLDAVGGVVPILGNIFDFAWKGHRKNLQLLERPESLPSILKEAGWKIAALVGFVVLLAFLLGYFVVALLTGYLDWVLSRPLP